MVVQFQPILGFGTRSSLPLKWRNAGGVNLRGHSFTTRFLYGVLQKSIYKDQASNFTTFLDHMMQNLYKLYCEGLNIAGRRMHFVVLGIKGDLPFLAKAGHLTRTFLNVRKAPETDKSKDLNGCCHLCLAGTKQYHFEDLSSSPGWLETIGAANPYPWNVLPPFLEYYPHVRYDAGSFFRLDVLHIYHLGVGRDFASSSLVMLLQLYEANSIQEGLERMNLDLQRFLKESHRQLHFKTLTRELLGFANEHSFPSGHWSKAMDTPVLMEFVFWLLQQYPSRLRDDKVFRLMSGAAHAMGLFMRTLLAADLWMFPQQAKIVSDAGLHFLKSYKKLSSLCHEQRLLRYNLTPKLHCFHHLCISLQQGLQRALPRFQNILCDCTFQDEDFVGRVSRLSRRVSPRLQSLRTLQRCLTATRQQLDSQI